MITTVGKNAIVHMIAEAVARAEWYADQKWYEENVVISIDEARGRIAVGMTIDGSISPLHAAEKVRLLDATGAVLCEQAVTLERMDVDGGVLYRFLLEIEVG